MKQDRCLFNTCYFKLTDYANGKLSILAIERMTHGLKKKLIINVKDIKYMYDRSL